MVFVKRDLGFAPAESPRLICEIWEPFTGGIGEMDAKPTSDRFQSDPSTKCKVRSAGALMSVASIGRPKALTSGSVGREGNRRRPPFIPADKHNDRRIWSLIHVKEELRNRAHGVRTCRVPTTQGGRCRYNRLGETGQQAGSDETQDVAHKHRMKTGKGGKGKIRNKEGGVRKAIETYCRYKLYTTNAINGEKKFAPSTCSTRVRMHNGSLRSLSCAVTILRRFDSELSDDAEVTGGKEGQRAQYPDRGCVTHSDGKWALGNPITLSRYCLSTSPKTALTARVCVENHI